MKKDKIVSIEVNSKITQSVIYVNKDNLIIKSTQPVSYVTFNVCLLFDLLKDSLSINSKNPGIKRRALQLRGLSLYEALEKTK